MDAALRTVTIEVASREQADERFLRAATTGEPQGAFITFPTVALLWRTLTPKRWALLEALTGAGPVSVREAARRVGRDVKRVHEDVCALVEAGLLDRTADGVVFPFDAMRVDFEVRPRAAAA